MKLSLSSGVLVPKYSRVTCHQAYNLLSHGSGKKKKKICAETLFTEQEIKQMGKMLTVDEAK